MRFPRFMRPAGPHDQRRKIQRSLRRLEAQLIGLEKLLEEGERIVAATESAVAALESAAIVEGAISGNLPEARAAVDRAKRDLVEQKHLRDKFIAARDAFRLALQ